MHIFLDDNILFTIFWIGDRVDLRVIIGVRSNSMVAYAGGKLEGRTSSSIYFPGPIYFE